MGIPAKHLPPDLTNRGRDRRIDERVPLAADVQLASGDNFFAGRARDISLGGLFIQTSAELDVGDEVRVRVQILDKAFAVPTEVVWILRDRIGHRVGLGVRFLQMPAPLRVTIVSFMQRRQPITFDVELSR